MSLSITIPDEVLTAAKIPRNAAKQALRQEMAFALYARGLASMGTARKLAKMDKWDFLAGLAERAIERHYHEEELREDVNYAAAGHK